MVTRRRFSSEETDARRTFKIGLVDDSVVERQNMQQIEMLTLVLVQAFNLDIKDSIGIEIDIHILFNPIGQTLFILLFHRYKLLLEARIVRVLSNAFKLLQFCWPFIADLVADKLR